ncbi:unnamed protein product [Dovyalis caffra]|uniref:Uncharacterized protein n=1 Tax=Dovyalis caffra TaxID=77055 RepID=A0AAV1S0T9_9ROSI|nr:unnamed protein product [Dovyalis caffra]
MFLDGGIRVWLSRAKLISAFQDSAMHRFNLAEVNQIESSTAENNGQRMKTRKGNLE